MSQPVRVLRDVQYAAPGGLPLYADLFLPEEREKKPPAIVWIHGGGWRFGDRRLAPDLSRFFGARGFAMVAIDYRLSHQAIFPAQIEDVKTAIRWLRSVAHVHGIDPDRIGLLGSSAGGHLAALAALAPDGLFVPPDAPYRGWSSRVQAVADGYGPTDFLQIDAHRPPDDTVSDDPETLLLPHGVVRSAAPDSFESLLMGAPIDGCVERIREANPITYAAPGAPPFLILHGLSDTTVPPHQSVLLYDALAACGVDVTLCLVQRLGHGFLHRTHLDDGRLWDMTLTDRNRMATERSGSIFSLVESFFRQNLAPDIPPPGINCGGLAARV